MQAKVKKWIVQLASGANVATILVMLAVGYSDRLNPASHPLMATLGLTFPVFLAINFGLSSNCAERSSRWLVSWLVSVLCARTYH